jgi:hypothetical protein
MVSNCEDKNKQLVFFSSKRLLIIYLPFVHHFPESSKLDYFSISNIVLCLTFNEKKKTFWLLISAAFYCGWVCQWLRVDLREEIEKENIWHKTDALRPRMNRKINLIKWLNLKVFMLFDKLHYTTAEKQQLACL